MGFDAEFCSVLCVTSVADLFLQNLMQDLTWATLNVYVP